MNFFYKLFFLFFGFCAFAQRGADTVYYYNLKAKKNQWLPSEIKIGGLNLVRGINTLVNDKVSLSYDITAEIDFHRFYLIYEYGVENNSWEKQFRYSTSGTFQRIGLGVNLIPYSANKNIVGFELRLAEANFSQKMDFDYQNLTGIKRYEFSNPNMRAEWMEACFSVKTRINKYICLGSLLRFKFFNTIYNRTAELEPYEVPGFGRYKDNIYEEKALGLGYDVYCYFTIPFRNKYVPVKTKKKKDIDSE